MQVFWTFVITFVHAGQGRQRGTCVWFLSNWMEYDRGDRFAFEFEWNMIAVTVLLLIWMEYDCGDSSPFDFIQNEISFGSKLNRKQTCPYDHILLKLKGIRKEYLWVYETLSPDSKQLQPLRMSKNSPRPDFHIYLMEAQLRASLKYFDAILQWRHSWQVLVPSEGPFIGALWCRKPPVSRITAVISASKILMIDFPDWILTKFNFLRKIIFARSVQ